MPTPILATKLHIPPPRTNLVARQRLLARMDEALHGKLTLVSAPAGFGKTTLVSAWINNLRLTFTHWPQSGIDDLRSSARQASAIENRQSKIVNRIAWLSLDPEDADPIRFLTYLVAALRRAVPDLGEEILNGLQAPQPPPPESLLTVLINEVAGLPHDLLLVLDDYHLVDAKSVDNLLAFLLEHQPPQLHLIITTREDPQLPLARLRARRELTEIRAVDLRFTTEEAAEFFRKITGLDLSPAHIDALEARTEGWIAGLQLAALALQGTLAVQGARSSQGRNDVHSFVEAFAGDHRYIVDYLVDEVLAQQPASVRDFLLQTSILGRMTGPLCDAVTEQADGAAMLESLERNNLFITPLDDRRRWFRYHHLFADVLRAHLQAEDPDLASTLHHRAAIWCEENNQSGDAIRHALAAEDFVYAATLLEKSWLPMDRNRQAIVWLGWAKALPDEVMRNRPVLTAAFGWALLEHGELEAAEQRLQQVERRLETTNHEDTNSVVVDEAQFAVLPATVASARTYLAQARGDAAGALVYARRALELLPPDDHLRRGVPASLLSLAAWGEGDLAAAAAYMTDAISSFRQAGNALYAITGAYVLADIHRAQGRLHAAVNVCRQALQLAEETGKFSQHGTADIHTSLAEIHREWNDLDTAAKALEHSQTLGAQSTLPRRRYRWCLCMARLRQAQGDMNNALSLLDEAEKHFVRGPIPELKPVSAWKVRIWIVQGRLADARRWVQLQTLTVNGETTYLREFEYITLARLLLAEDENHRALTLLARLLQAAEQGERMGSVLEILVLQALAHHAQDDIDAALHALTRALDIAAPEGYVRIFVDEGQRLRDLLSAAAEREIASPYVATLMAAFADAPPKQPEDQPVTPTTPSPSEQPLIEPLSERELEVLHLIADGLSNNEICERLFLALSTVKGHNRNIYGKLQVQRRTEAIARARELGLIP